MAESGTMETVELRTVWPKETDFSAWLAEHVDILNEQLACEIEPRSVQPEERAWGGRKRVDLLGDATFPGAPERFKVIVENQLEDTDSEHLGDVLQYAAAFDARVAIWIAERADPGHVEAVRWLNEHTTDVDFHLFTIALKRIGDSRPAPVLTRVAGPDPRRPGARGGRSSDPEHDQKIRDWYARVLPKVAEACRTEARSKRRSAVPSNGKQSTADTGGSPGAFPTPAATTAMTRSASKRRPTRSPTPCNA